MQFHFFHLKNNFSNPPLNSFEEYQKYTICGQNESAAAPVFNKLKIKYDTASDLPTVFRKVAAGRCDFGFSSDLAFTKFVQSNSLGEQFIIDKFIILDVFADILINSSYPNAKKIAQDLSSSLERMRKDGSLQRLAEKNLGAGAVPEYFLKF
jgi:ABC-type amino acid transport substrate-binding protein